MIVYFDEAEHVTEDMLQKMKLMLFPQRKAKIAKYRKRDSQKMGILSYVLFRFAVFRAFGYDEKRPFSINENGKPYLDGLEFNISHTSSGVACIVDRMPVGIDIQDKKENYEKISRRVCTKGEQQNIETASDPAAMFTKFWALKEAYVKYKGTGIWDFIDQIDYSNLNSCALCKDGLYYHVIEEKKYMIASCSKEPQKIICHVSLVELNAFVNTTVKTNVKM